MDIHTTSAPRRLLTLAAGTLLAAGVVTGLSACNGGAQTPYPEQTSTDTPTPTPTQSDPETPVPRSSDDSGTLGG
ncbi:MAG: hypothetical protein Q7T71_19645 [Herbiconiux sp.]|nr:hypothetical protein [Herbiconiux sp.]